MKDSKDFDVNPFVSDGTPTEPTVATDDAQPSKQSVSNAMSEPGAPTVQNEVVGKAVPTPSSGQAVKPRQTVPTSPSQRTGPAPFTEPGGPSTPSETPAPSADTFDSPDTRTNTDSDTPRRTVKQRRSELDEYKRLYMQTPRIEDRKPVFVSRSTRDRLDRIVRLLGERGMSVSGLIENIARRHLNTYEADIECWRKM